MALSHATNSGLASSCQGPQRGVGYRIPQENILGFRMDRQLMISRGNCPCLRTGPRELVGADRALHCEVDEDRCSAEDLVAELPAELCADRAIDMDQPGPVHMRLSDFLGVFGGDLGDRFLLVCSPRVEAAIDLIDDVGVPITVLEWRVPEDRRELISLVAAIRGEGLRASILWIAETEFEHYLREHIEGMKLAAIPFFSSEFSQRKLRRYLDIITRTDYVQEEKLEEKLVEILEESTHLVLETPALGTSCTFHHLEAEHWFSLHGPLAWADQTVLPTGELSTLTDASGDFTDDSHFLIDGQIVFKGSPIVHRGDPSVTPAETEAMFMRLSPMQDVPVIAELENGFITRFVAPVPEARGLRDTFSELVRAEPRYRKIYEFGFGTHELCRRRLRINFHPNERWPGIHIGLGLGGYTPFHLDLAQSEVTIFGAHRDGSRINLYEQLGLR